MNSYVQLYLTPSLVFAGRSKPFEEADYVIIGVPYDGTSTFRAGSRFGPLAIREASLHIETYTLRSRLDIEDLNICDLGNLDTVDDLSENLKRITRVIREVVSAGKKPIIIGGEHTMAFGAIDALEKDIAIVDFDAHMDLRDEYAGRKLSHTTFMRRLAEKIGSDQIVQIGTRAVCKDDLTFAEKSKLRYFTSSDINKLGVSGIVKRLKEILSPYSQLYLTIDMDVLDPAYAPAVGCPEPDGISTTTLLDILQGICDYRFLGFDLTEVTPYYDAGTTAIQAAKIIFEVISYLERAKKVF